MISHSNEHNGTSSRWQYARALRALRRPGVVIFLLTCAVVGIAAKWIVDSKESAECHSCQLRLRFIGGYMTVYKERHGALPPAYLVDEDGKPINSWRILVASQFWYHFDESGFDLNKPWNGPDNSPFGIDRDPAPDQLRCPAHSGWETALFTDYVAVVGANTMWPGSKGAVPALDGSDDEKILLIEIINSDIPWMEPRDLTLEQALDAFNPKSGLGIGSTHRCGINYLTVGGEVRTLSRNISRDSLRKLLVRD